MALSTIQSIVARLSAAEDARAKAEYTWSIVREPNRGAEMDGELKKLRHELLLAGLRDLVGHDRLTIQQIPVERFKPVPVIISIPQPKDGGHRATFGPLLAKELNRCTKDHWAGAEDQFVQQVKPSDHECIRSERMIQGLLANVALDHCNGTPTEVLDPITPAEMAAFAFPGGLLSGPKGNGAGPTPEA